MIIGILGFAQTGKDTVANLLAEEGAQKIGFADALKRLTMQVFDFEPHQMWGTIQDKETPDKRYPRDGHTWSKTEAKCLCCGMSELTWSQSLFKTDAEWQCYLTPRYALKIVGTEGARHCWSNIWVKKGVNAAELITRGFTYNQMLGIENSGGPRRHAIFIDCRFKNEIAGIQAAGGKVFRLKRPGYDKPMFDHPSETEQLQIPDDRLQGVIHNDGTLEDLKAKVYALLQEASP